MPRNGSDIYYILPGTEGFPDTTIESEKYNNYIHDVETDLNRPRPIIAGGTGANNAKDARVALGAEVAGQQVINYDSHVFESGSFWSDLNATGGPISGHTFGGTSIVLANNNPNHVILIARDQSDGLNPGRTYVRQKISGVWGPWSQDNTGVMSATPPVNPPDGLLWWNSTDGQLYVYYNDGNSKQWVIASPSPDPAQFVRKSGDTMTGPLNVNGYILTSQDAATGTVYFGDGNKYLSYGSGTFSLIGGPLNTSQGINVAGSLAAGSITTSGNLNAANVFASAFRTQSSSNAAQGVVYFGNTPSSVYLSYDGVKYNLIGGDLNVQNVVVASEMRIAAGVHGVLRLGNADKYLWWNGSSFFLNGPTYVDGPFNSAANITLSGAGACFVPPNGSNGGFTCKDALTNNFTGNYFNIGYYGNNESVLFIDNTSMGLISTSSDYRIKKDIAPIGDTWEAVKALNPIKYTHKDFTPPSEAENKQRKGPFFRGDDIERWGFVAHELQETLVKSAATGKKDAPDTIQSVDAMTVVAALTKALQEAMARIEALEAKV